MFSSLDRVDIVLKPEPDGRQRFVQTDHRTAAEMEQQLELSALLALVRILNPKRLAEGDSLEPVITYSAKERPPELLRRVILAAGGRLVIGDDLQPEAQQEEGAPTLEAVVEPVFESLARAVASEYRVTLTPDGLKSVEVALAALAGDREEDEAAYWSSVLKLGSFGGEIIRASNGGRWVVTSSGSLPFSLSTRFRGEDATVNPLGKAIKRFANGEEDSLVALVNMLQSEP